MNTFAEYFESTHFAQSTGVKYDPLNDGHLEIALFAHEQFMLKEQQSREARRHAARHRRYRAAALLNRSGRGRLP